MLFISLVLSAILLTVVGVALARHKKPGFGFGMLGLSLCCVPALGSCFFPCVALQVFVLFGLALTDAYANLKHRTYFVVACLGTLVVYVAGSIHGAVALSTVQSKYPIESLERRLPPVRTAKLRSKPIDDEVLASFENRVDTEWARYFTELRSRNLQKIHEGVVGVFVNAAGFGNGRVPFVRSLLESGLDPGLGEERTIPQAIARDSEVLSLGNPGRAITGPVDAPGRGARSDARRDSCDQTVCRLSCVRARRSAGGVFVRAAEALRTAGLRPAAKRLSRKHFTGRGECPMTGSAPRCDRPSSSGR